MMERIQKNLAAMVNPLRTRKGWGIMIGSSGALFVIFFGVAILLNALTLPTMEVSFGSLILFATLKAVYQLILLDWILLIAISLAGGLLVAQYFHKRCATPKTGAAGLTLGTLAATCPACLAPVFGIVSAGGFLGTASYVVKFLALGLLLGGTYWIANKPQICEPPTHTE